MSDDLNDPSSSSATWQQRAQLGDDLHDSLGETEESEDDGRKTREERRKAGMAQKLQFMSHLQKSLDMIVYAYLCTLYYMECSLPRFLVRVLPYHLFLSPKENAAHLLPAPSRPHVFAILVPNLFCIFLHLVLALPQAGETERGYLHGGIIVDIIGQKPPTSRLSLLYLDLVILAVQCLMLAVHQERDKLQKVVTPSLRTVASVIASAAEVGAAPTTTQDHDAEERGVLRDAATDDADGIELQPLSRRSRTQGGEEREDPLDNGHFQSREAPDLLDVMVSGNAILADFHVVHAIRTVGNDVENAAAYSLQTLGYTTATLAARAAMAAERRRRLGLQRR
ncbi:DSC E3 ubiquitin ligase complex subunit 4 [Diplogelasinospora grovesii]|uniref:DSC E3 ubiquitin ligase complex subunit 4 n=1 Tax=Diplogelasinospora grovesii TaxID=303347 RepID=A0AAN6MYV2_9PEZI|nr:DSC E3 ubiquitin ligase complex subunit 4 [Diplogelasinospora grovesii]